MNVPLPDDTRERLIRLEERVDALQKEVRRLREDCVSKNEFQPVRFLAYGGAALALAGVVGAVLTLIFRSSPC